MPLISCKNLSKIYDSGSVRTVAVADVSFDIKKGEFVSIMGSSGSGKSTLMHMLGLLDRPTDGTYLFEGKDMTKFDENTLAKLRNMSIGFVFQSFNLLPRTSVFENVELPLLYNLYEKSVQSRSVGERMRSIVGGMGSSAHKKRVADALRSVDMEDRIAYKSNQLSGGEKQRVAIARALVNNPSIIFADEPTGNLDSKSGLQVMQILQRLNGEGRTVILVTHETYTAEHARRILYMKDGRIESDDTVTEWRDARKEENLK